jgi:hypothetical protein
LGEELTGKGYHLEKMKRLLTSKLHYGFRDTKGFYREGKEQGRKAVC